MEILVRNRGARKWQKVREQQFQTEAALQNILYESPDIIPIEKLGEQLKEPKLFVKEAGLPGSGNTDLIGIDEEGGITIIECKLATNTDTRRKVIGQVLEYAAYLWQMAYEDFDEVCWKAEKWGERHLTDVMQERIGHTNESWSAEDFKQALSSTLKSGNFRLIIAVDALNDELRRIVEYLNSRGESSSKIFVLEMRQFETPDFQMLVPELFGPSTTGGRGESAQWDEASFLRVLEAKQGTDEAEIARRILQWAKDKATRIWWGKGARYGSFTPILDHKGTWFSIVTVWTNGYVEVQFQLLQNRPHFDDESKRLDLLRRFNEIDGVAFPNDAITKKPSINMSTLIEQEAFDQFLKVLDWFVQEIKAS